MRTSTATSATTPLAPPTRRGCIKKALGGVSFGGGSGLGLSFDSGAGCSDWLLGSNFGGTEPIVDSGLDFSSVFNTSQITDLSTSTYVGPGFGSDFGSWSAAPKTAPPADPVPRLSQAEFNEWNNRPDANTRVFNLKESFVDTEAHYTHLGEFLYLQRGVRHGRWTFGNVGSTNAVLLWKDAFDYFTNELKDLVEYPPYD
jgi:hypothetical protein